jgi:hypothetical protein
MTVSVGTQQIAKVTLVKVPHEENPHECVFLGRQRLDGVGLLAVGAEDGHGEIGCLM